MSWMFHLWPGLAALRDRGDAVSLACALAYGASLSLAIAASLLWTDWLSATGERLLWVGLVVSSVGSVLFADVSLRRRPPGSNGADDALRDASQAYLRGDFYEAEVVIRSALRRYPRDIELRLLFATLLRHSRRYDEALSELDHLSRLDESWKWAVELGQERRLTIQARRGQQAEEQTTPPREASEEPAGIHSSVGQSGAETEDSEGRDRASGAEESAGAGGMDRTGYTRPRGRRNRTRRAA